MTVLFADLKGSMELLADRDPEEARKLLDPVLEHMMEAVHRYEGTVNQVMGDGIMALFGAPVAHEDHAVRACYAALRMQESVKRYAEGCSARTASRPDPPGAQLRRGRRPGDRLRPAHGLHGSRADHAPGRPHGADGDPGTILLAPRRWHLAEGYVQVASRGPVPVKGLAGPMEIFELTGASPLRSGSRPPRLVGSPVRGSRAEFELLRQSLERAREGHGQLVAVVGEPGVGKSRLPGSSRTRIAPGAGWCSKAASVSYGKATTYSR